MYVCDTHNIMGGDHPDEDVRELAAALIEVSAMLVRQMPNRHGMTLTTMSTLGRLEREGRCGSPHSRRPRGSLSRR